VTRWSILRIAIAVLAALALAPAAAHAGTITVQVSGSGDVRDDKGQINCPSASCSASYNDGSVTFTATPRGNATFQGWSGACSQYAGNTCTVNGGFDAEIGAAFSGESSPPPPPPPPPEEARRFPVRVLLTGPGAGRVGSLPGGIDCFRALREDQRGACEASFPEGTELTLERRDGTFQQWGGACSGTQHTCRLIVRGPLDVSAFFWVAANTPGSVQVTVQGGGAVEHVESLIRCGALCTFIGNQGQVLTFRPLAQVVPRFPNSIDTMPEDVVFHRWNSAQGDCNTTGRTATCRVRINGIEAHDVFAVFRRKGSMRFRVRGRGIVRTTRRPTTGTDRIECSTDCTVLLRDDEGTHTWEAEPEPGWRFSHWSGYCERALEDETCSAREEAGTRSSTATFVRDAGRGEARLAIHTNVGGVRLVDGFNASRTVCPARCLVRAERRSGGTFSARVRPIAPGEAEFRRWENCPRVLAGNICEIRSRDRVDDVIRAYFEADPIARFRVSGQGRMRRGTTQQTCDPLCRYAVPASLRSPMQVVAVPAAGWYFSHYDGYCGSWFRSSGATCFLRGLWDDETSTAVFRRLGGLTVSVRGGGTLRAVFPGSGFASTERFTCREDTSPCVQTNARAPLYRRYRADADAGWRFSHWEGYCHRIFYNNECDVPGDNERRSTVAVFVR
jgi:hypothetical protein